MRVARGLGSTHVAPQRNAGGSCGRCSSLLRRTSVLPGFRTASWTATVESSQAATAIVAGATAGDDSPYLRADKAMQ